MSRRQRYKTWTQRVEGSLLRVTIALCVLLVVAQTFLARDEARRYLSYVDRLEGVSLDVALADEGVAGAVGARSSVAKPSLQGPWLVLRLEGRNSADSAVVLVNGQPVARFSRAEVTIPVKDGDLLEIDGASYRSELRFRVSRASSGVTEPVIGTEVICRRDIALMGRVKTKGP
ncbi:MAG TPA: hypothetical protein VGL40_05305 [Bacillota bacterium]|jgi:hypothetical protein